MSRPPAQLLLRSSLWRAAALGVALVTAARAQTQSSATDGAAAALPEPPSGAALLQELRRFGEMGTVLHVAAHPDDENTALLTFLARGRNYRTAYLSITRGDGGQNVLGPELDEKLGVARTQELLAARRLDGARQYFTRAVDFGFSKDYQDALRQWGREEVLGDVVRVIRVFRPDVIVTRFPTQASGTHGHHTASAVLAVEAFSLAGDPKAYLEQIAQGLAPWQPKRIFLNGGGRGRGRGTSAGGQSIAIEAGGDDPVLGESFASIAGRSRARHMTQFGPPRGGGRGAGGGPRTETFILIEGEPATADIMDGIDTTWARVPGGADVAKLVSDAIAAFSPDNPPASVPALLAIKEKVAALPDDPLVSEKRGDLDKLIAGCLGLTYRTTVANPEAVPGEKLPLTSVARARASIPVRWLGTQYPGSAAINGPAVELRPGTPAERTASPALPANTPLSQPYWLREDGTRGLARVADPLLIGLPENPPAFPLTQVFETGGQKLSLPDAPVQVSRNAEGVEIVRNLEVIPPVTLHFKDEVALFHPGAARTLDVAVTATRPAQSGTLSIAAPDGWRVSPASQPFSLAKAGDTARAQFTVTAPAAPGTATLAAQASVAGATYGVDRVDISYGHLPLMVLQPAARLTAVAMDWAVRGKKIGYLPGAGDNVAEALEQLGYEVTRLTGADLTEERLRGFDAVVTGIRAFNVRNDLAAGLPALFAYAENGGTVVVQYNRPNDLRTDTLAPFPLRIANQRVTDENAAVAVNLPEHPALNSPNKIVEADFAGWVQERGIYFPTQWDERFQALFSIADPGEDAAQGSLLIAPCGKGYFVYTGLAFFRQLPAGVSGAYRLFANLVSLGK